MPCFVVFFSAENIIFFTRDGIGQTLINMQDGKPIALVNMSAPSEQYSNYYTSMGAALSKM